VGIGVCVAITLLWYAATISPLIRQQSLTADLRGRIRDQQRTTERTKAATVAAQQQLQVVRQELAAGGIRLDSAVHINTRIARLTEFFSECALHVDDIQTGRIRSGLQCDLVPIAIVGRGAYPPCVRFLHKLCSAFPDMSVMQVEFRGAPAREVRPQQFRFEMFWYAVPNGVAWDDDGRTTGLVADDSWSFAP
jgi:hypothetical protein